jgi:hypothetical protein
MDNVHDHDHREPSKNYKRLVAKEEHLVKMLFSKGIRRCWIMVSLIEQLAATQTQIARRYESGAMVGT